jgi:hypothetical protein
MARLSVDELELAGGISTEEELKVAVTPDGNPVTASDTRAE